MYERESEPRLSTVLARTPAARPAATPPKKVLLVEDTTMIRQIMARLLVCAGYEVLEAGSAAEAFEILWGHPDAVDVLVSDFTLPDMNGRQLLKEVRRLQPEIRALFVTGDPSEVASERYLAKPFLPGELLAAVNETVNARVLRRAEAL